MHRRLWRRKAQPLQRSEYTLTPKKHPHESRRSPGHDVGENTTCDPHHGWMISCCIDVLLIRGNLDALTCGGKLEVLQQVQSSPAAAEKEEEDNLTRALIYMDLKRTLAGTAGACEAQALFILLLELWQSSCTAAGTII